MRVLTALTPTVAAGVDTAKIDGVFTPVDIDIRAEKNKLHTSALRPPRRESASELHSYGALSITTIISQIGGLVNSVDFCPLLVDSRRSY